MIISSDAVVRMFVSFFSLEGFTSMSPTRAFSPTTMPSYTGSPGLTNIVPRSCQLKSAYPTATPSRPRHGERLGVVRFLPPQGHVLLELPKQPIAQLPARHELPFPSRERRVVHLEVHGDRGLLHRDAREPLQIVGGRHRLADLDAHEARQRHDVAGRGFLYLDPLQPVERKQLQDRKSVV